MLCIWSIHHTHKHIQTQLNLVSDENFYLEFHFRICIKLSFFVCDCDIIEMLMFTGSLDYGQILFEMKCSPTKKLIIPI